MLSAGCDLGAPLPDASTSPVRITEVQPAPVDGGVTVLPIGAPFRIVVDRLLAPSTVTRGALRITSGPFSVYGGVRYDPVRREVRFVPNAPDLRPGLRYVFRVGEALRAWDGAPLLATVDVPFVPQGRAEATAATVPSLRARIAPMFAARCASARCHGGEAPAMGLDLRDADAIIATAVGRIARETDNGRGTPDYTDPRWGALLRIDPGDAPGLGRPEYSYLVYKLLGDGPIRGGRMPPDAPLPIDDIAAVADWIAAGAPRE